ncbi:Phosphatidylserine-specific receptor PtdSerR, contains JmjC domain [Handroanthus impetiginosus]|uniref:Phosphatidylserine-specific receptor PtdSerR, contains JmjC domain n=1 Tax=Handroanthus impetiginosus TaxID=429701 RepID=A0A2G9HLP9_9LAMI|nr:Phosphatidylserine-specific receptor PtdSerR, contains JmjC domain [Handroanthus impetiginosus]
MEDHVQIRQFNRIPSAEEFASQIERKNVPAVFTGCVKEWKAFSKWNVRNGGLDYLHELVGSSVVEAMLSRSAPIFYGDIRSHERVPLPFSTFIGYCKDLLQYREDDQDSVSELRMHKPVGLVTEHGDSNIGEESPQQIYLAQVPIVNAENAEKVQVEPLREDIETPAFLEGKRLESVNLWMNNARTRSSTHYDPHHNLLCIISGCKEVVLWPPSACPVLYPLPLYGEASNHSAIPLENPNFSLYPRAKSIDEYSQKVILHAGDALFIPEGWFHQVDSGDLTVAVNFWWRSDIMSGMLEHMDGYYLRRILRRLTDKEMERMLCVPSSSVDRKVTNATEQSRNEHAGYCDQYLDMNHQADSLRGKPEQGFSLHDLEPHALRSLHELVSLVHDRVGESQSVGNVSEDEPVSGEEDGVKKIANKNLFSLDEDPIANIVWTLEPRAFQSVFLAMAHNFPRTLEAFILHALSPVGVEVLTRKFEQLDQIMASDDRSQFYEKFYSVFDNKFSAMDALLNGKESFACQAFSNVLVQYLGINLDQPKPSGELLTYIPHERAKSRRC